MTLRKESVTLGVDVGGGGVRAVAIDITTAEVRASSEVDLVTTRGENGARTQDAHEWIDAAFAAINRTVQQLGDVEILSMGCTSAAHNVVLRDAHNRMNPIMLWSDGRPDALVERLDSSIKSLVRDRACVELDSTWSYSQLLWMRQELSVAPGDAAAIYVGHELLTHALTGARGVDSSAAAGTALRNMHTGDWDSDLLRSAGLADHQFGTIVSADHVIGRVTTAVAERTGLASGTPVVAGATDTACELLALGVSRLGEGLLKLATTGTATQLVDRVVDNGRALLYPYVDSDRWYLVSPTNTSWSAVRWCEEVLGVSALELAATIPAGANGLTFFPYLDGERVPLWDRSATASLHGLRRNHSAGHIARAVLEGVIFSLRQALEFSEAVSGYRMEPANLTGGGSRYPLVQDLVSAVTERTITSREATDPAVGAARLAARGVGVQIAYSDQRRLIDPPACNNPIQVKLQEARKEFERQQHVYFGSGEVGGRTTGLS